MTPEQHLNNVARGLAKRGGSANEVSAMRCWIEDTNFKKRRCFYCAIKLTGTTWSLDHDKPLSKGGGHSLDNFRLCCKKCNRAKGDMSGQEYLSLRAFLFETLDSEVANSVIRRLAASGFMFRRH